MPNVKKKFSILWFSLQVALQCAILFVVLRFAAPSLWARQLAAGPPIALAQTKALLNRSSQSSLVNALESEAAAQSVNFGTADTAEAIGAFLQKREPHYTGR